MSWDYLIQAVLDGRDVLGDASNTVILHPTLVIGITIAAQTGVYFTQ